MVEGHSIKADNKPTLFSWDLETEYQNVDRQLFSGRKADADKLREMQSQLKQLKTDLFEIIQSKQITDSQILRIFDLVKNGRGGVWETATTELERLAFHFDKVKFNLLHELKGKDSKYVSRLITSIGDFLDKEELKKISKELMGHKSKKVRGQILGKILDLRVIDLKNELQLQKDKEETSELRDYIDFVMKHIDQPKGRLTIERVKGGTNN